MKQKAVVAAVEALLAAAQKLPENTRVADKDAMIAALKAYDAAEEKLDDAIDAYMASARKGLAT